MNSQRSQKPYLRGGPIGLFVALALSLFLPTVTQAQQGQVVDQQRAQLVKLAYILNLAKYVKNASPVDQKHMVVGIYGTNPFQANHIKKASGRAVSKTKTLKIVEIKKMADWVPCDIVFIPSSTGQQDVAAIIEASAGKSILLVGEDSAFLQSGGVVNFSINNQGSIDLQLSITNMKKHKLQFDARLMKLCKPFKAPKPDPNNQ